MGSRSNLKLQKSDMGNFIHGPLCLAWWLILVMPKFELSLPIEYY